MNRYVSSVIEQVKAKNASEPEFIQAVEEVLVSLSPVVDKHPEYEAANLLGRLVEPERQVSFRVSWVDDAGNVQVNRGYRVQFNSAIGPYKGGLRFHPSVYSGIIKFLAFEQTLKNSLTGLPMGGGKGGSDFDPIGKSDAEIMRFCQAFMSELYRHIGPDTDVPAGDIGVGAREIGYLFGQYKRIKGAYEGGVLTGKGLSYGGLQFRTESTGAGGIYYACEMFKHFGDSIEGKKFILSGFGNVTWGAASKIAELGGKVLTISGIDGYIYDEEGVSTKEKLDYLLVMRRDNLPSALKDYAAKFGAQYVPGKKPWGVAADVAIPCATQNEVNLEDAKAIVESGVQYYAELSNMPTSNEALEYLKKNLKAVGPAKAVNAGGVACSLLEMSQNAQRVPMDRDKVNSILHGIMKNIHDQSAKTAEEYGIGYDLVAGANIYGFLKVATAMMEQGIV